MVESFPSKEKGTTTKHVKTFRVRLLLSSVAFEIWEDDEYHTCLAWGCSLCNQTTTVSHRLVSESLHKEPSSNWCTQPATSLQLTLPNLSAAMESSQPGAEPGHAESMKIMEYPRKTLGICKGPHSPVQCPHFKPSAHTKCKARVEGTLHPLADQQTAEMKKK